MTRIAEALTSAMSLLSGGVPIYVLKVQASIAPTPMPTPMLTLREPINHLLGQLEVTEFPDVDGMTTQTILDAWEFLRTAPRPAPIDPDHDLFAVIRDAEAPVSFAGLPLATQMFLAGPGNVTDWYAPRVIHEGAGAAPALRAIVTSTWTHQMTTVGGFAAYFSSAFARRHFWPDAPREMAPWFHELVDADALFTQGKASAPVVILDGRPHEECVAYLVALLRFCDPSTPVAVIMGDLSAERFREMPLPRPPYAMPQWSATGRTILPRGMDDADATLEDRVAIRDRMTLERERARTQEVLAMDWAQDRLDGIASTPGSVQEYLSQAHDRLTAHHAPFAGMNCGLSASESLARTLEWISPPSPEQQLAWTPPASASESRPGPWYDYALGWWQDVVSGAMRRRTAIKPVRRRLKLAGLIERFGGSPLVSVLPELAVAVDALKQDAASLDSRGYTAAECQRRNAEYANWSRAEDDKMRAELKL